MAGFFKSFFYSLIIPFALYPQSPDIKFEQISVDQGLSNAKAKCILQDSKGFIWIGTEYGLNRYDGYTIKVFTHNPINLNSISDNYIKEIYEDPADRGRVIWIGTRGGLNKFDVENEQFTRYLNEPDDPTSLSHNNVTSICKDNNGFLWVGTWPGGLNRLNVETGKFINFKNDPQNRFSLSDNRVLSTYSDHEANLWIGAKGCLNKLILSDNSADKHIESQPKKEDKYQFQRFYPDQTDPTTWLSIDIYNIFEDHNRVLWVASNSGLYTFDRKTNQLNLFNLISGKNGIENIRWPMSIFEDTADALWLSTIEQGLVNINSERNRLISYQHDPNSSNNFIPPHNNISQVMVDHSDVIWIAAFEYGVIKLIPKRKKNSKLPTCTRRYDQFKRSNRHFNL